MAEEKVLTSDKKEVATKQTDEVAVDSHPELAAKPKPSKRKKAKRNISRGQVHLLATFNNTIVTVTDEKGNTLSTASAGSTGFRGSKKGTAYAAQVAAEKAIEMAKTFGLSKVEVFVKGVGLGREAAIRTLMAQRINVDSIKDKTAVAHGGARPRKAKRN
ncbi:30S ribosomal protein S11 [Candidatus Saccharibacteria bacterium]|nr:30S ribosomal protein S11 [Candidatus Saccharibacteria bacterium]